MHPQSKTDNIPSIEPDKNWRIWWTLLRPHTLTASFVPVTLGTVLALLEGQVNIWIFLAMLFASILIQSATNMFNEYFDFKRGLDNENSVGIGGTIVRNGVKPKTVLNLGYIFIAVATLLGVYICMASSWWIAVIGLVCMAFGYLYSGGPIPISYTPFGEVASGLLMGTVIILISFFIQTGNVTFNTFLISLPISILIGAINLSNNIRDLDGDKENGRKTLAILVGRPNAIKILAGSFIFSYLFIFILFLTGIISVWAFIVLLSVPKARNAVKGFIGKSKPIEMMPAMKFTAQTNTFYGLLLSLGIFIGYYI